MNGALRLLPALLAVLACAAVAAATTPHAPILIEGDEAFCAPASGVVNCDEADGTQAMPYRIAGWSISAMPSASTLCGQTVHAAIAICATDAHVVLEDLDLEVPATMPVEAASVGGVPPGTAVHLHGSGNVSIERVRIETAGRAIHVQDQPDRHSRRAMPPVTMTGGRITSTAPSALSLVRNVNGDLLFTGTEIDAAGRLNAIHSVFLDDAGGRHAPHLAVREVHLYGALFQGIQVQGGSLDVRASTLSIEATSPTLTGPASGLQIALVSLLDGAQAHLEGNTFTFGGTAVELSDAAEVLVRSNRFAGGPEDAAMEVSRDGPERPCALLVDYNDLGALRLVNHADDCAVMAPHNWWGGEAPAASQLEGLVEVPAWSPVRLDAMPQVDLEGAPEATSGRLRLEGTVSGPATHLLLEGDWSATRDVRPGPFRWDVGLDQAPVGALRLRLHGCSAVVCGPPVEWGLQRLPAALPPVALVTVVPSVVEVGGPIHLDASGSFSPQGTPITAYRFEDRPWSAQPTYTVRSTQPGAVAISVIVQDAEGRISKPVLASAHVRAPVASQVDTPLPALAMAVACLLGTAATRRPR